jgi:hypothetical protein
MLTNSHQVPAPTQALPKTQPNSAARRGGASCARQASSATHSSGSTQAPVSEKVNACSAPRAPTSGSSSRRIQRKAALKMKMRPRRRR